MQKNTLFTCLNYSTKFYFFYSLQHFIFQDAFKFQLEIFPLHLFSVQNINTQKTSKQLLQFQS